MMCFEHTHMNTILAWNDEGVLCTFSTHNILNVAPLWQIGPELSSPGLVIIKSDDKGDPALIKMCYEFDSHCYWVQFILRTL